MGFGKFFNKLKNGGTKFFNKVQSDGGKFLGKVSGGLDQVANIANQVANNPMIQQIGNAAGDALGMPGLGSQISNVANKVSNVASQGSQLTNTKNYAGQDFDQIKNNVLERVGNIQSSIQAPAGPTFV
jgi:phage-related protein